MSPGNRLDLPLELGIDHQLAAGHARQRLDRAIVVRRPETAGDEAEIRLDACPQGVLQLCRSVPDDDDPRRTNAQRDKLASEKRAIQVAAVTSDELAACDDDDRPRVGLRQVAGGAFVIVFGVTSSDSGFPWAAPGITTIFPLSLATRFCGLLAENQI
jgi:hypothetical protein